MAVGLGVGVGYPALQRAVRSCEVQHVHFCVMFASRPTPAIVCLPACMSSSQSHQATRMKPCCTPGRPPLQVLPRPAAPRRCALPCEAPPRPSSSSCSRPARTLPGCAAAGAGVAHARLRWPRQPAAPGRALPAQRRLFQLNSQPCAVHPRQYRLPLHSGSHVGEPAGTAGTAGTAGASEGAGAAAAALHRHAAGSGGGGCWRAWRCAWVGLQPVPEGFRERSLSTACTAWSSLPCSCHAPRRLQCQTLQLQASFAWHGHSSRQSPQPEPVPFLWGHALFLPSLFCWCAHAPKVATSGIHLVFLLHVPA